MKWRNEQIYHLRQNKLLTEIDQDAYFENVVAKLFGQIHPEQILFSYLKGDICIGYGGLVHINWIDRNAEISFVMDTGLEKEFFGFHWKTYLSLIEKVAFEELQFHKIFTYAFDLRPKLYHVLEQSGYNREARLQEHCCFEGKYLDVVIHSKINHVPFLRDASMEDLQVTYNWANHPHTREFSFNKGFISLESHGHWFQSKLTDTNCIYKLLIEGGVAKGSVRIDITNGVGLISFLIAPEHVGMGYGSRILEMVIGDLRVGRIEIKTLKALVKKENSASTRIFEKLEFEGIELDGGVLEYRKALDHADR